MRSPCAPTDEMYRRSCELRVLLAVSSKHGSTAEIGQSIAVQLRMEDVDVDERDVQEVSSVEGYDAVILGSAVYMGRLLDTARAFIEAHEAQLLNIPVWLFSSGPIGVPDPKRQTQAPEVDALVAKIHARDHKVFAGKLDKHELGLVERVAAKVVGASEGDFRDWEAIESWARDIAHQLMAEKV
jgi:menaquinone-dependent protoporphyrinogen oxidase